MDYRLCLLDKDGHVSRTEEFVCFNDYQAIEHLVAIQYDHEVELWGKKRRIASRPASAPARMTTQS